MSIASQLVKLADNKAAIKAAIEAKSPTVPPTDSLAQWPEAIASIPSGGEQQDEWTPPSDWPDIKASIKAYPTGATDGESNVLVFLFDCTNATSIRMRCGTSYRFSDDPGSVVTSAKNTYVYRSVQPGTRYVWVAAYASDFVFFGDANYASSTNDGSSYVATGIVWIAGSGVAEARCWNALNGCRAIENGLVTFNKRGGGGGYLQGSNSLNKWSYESISLGESSLNNCFYGCHALTSLAFPDVINTSSVVNFSSMFHDCNSLRILDLSMFDTSSATNMGNMFYNNGSLVILDLTSFDMSSVTNVTNMFGSCYSLRSLIGGRDYTPQADPNKGPRVSISLVNSSPLDRQSLLWLINWLADLTALGLSSQTLTLNAAAKHRISTDDIAVATSKGWTIA